MKIQIEKTSYGFVGRFKAMAGPCECLIESDDPLLAEVVTQVAANEAWRIEQKYSRYQTDNVCYQINQSHGQPVPIDSETFQLLEYANTCFQLSSGLFDITSGVLRRVWQFKKHSKVPSQKAIDELLPVIGWEMVKFDELSVTLEPKMEIDFGGIGKEYAVDRVAQLILKQAPKTSVVVNFGGDLRVTQEPKLRPKWIIGVDCLKQELSQSIEIGVGAVCTSGDTERFIIYKGKRYCHILNPNTGWPVENSPKTVTVIADQCMQSGLLATLAMLQGEQAELFLEQQDVRFFCQR